MLWIRTDDSKKLVNVCNGKLFELHPVSPDNEDEDTLIMFDGNMMVHLKSITDAAEELNGIQQALEDAGETIIDERWE